MKIYRLNPKWIAYYLVNMFEVNGIPMTAQVDNDFLTKRGIMYSFRMAVKQKTS